MENFNSAGNECFGFTWYISADMQLYLISPLLIWVMYHYKMLGIVLNCILGVICMVVQFILVRKYHLSYILFKFNDTFFKYYGKPYMRAPAYIIGLTLGYAYYLHRS